MHSFQPTANDILKISACDLFIYVGGESDQWVEDALAEAINKDMVVLNLLDILGDRVKTEELAEGMEEEYEEADEEDSEVEEELDEHVWLSLNNTSAICDAIAEALSGIDDTHGDVYKTNADVYKEELAALDDQYRQAVEDGDKKTLLFGDRFPFRYLTDEYGLDYYAAFSGCSAETEASFETVVFLAGKADKLGLSSIMTIEGNDHRIAETIRDNTQAKDQQILTMDSMQSTTYEDISKGVSYLSVMKKNLDVLKKALQ